MKFPMVIKPSDGGSSCGVSIVNNIIELKRSIKEAKKYSDNIIIEEYIKGRELECAILENNKDLGAQPSVINIHNEVLRNDNFRTAIWTGEYLQVTVMSIPVGGEIGLELHNDLDQFIRVESGCAAVYMGKTKQNVKLVGKINSNYAIVIPAGTWHNVINSCSCPLKVYSVYAPPQHPFGTIHETKLDSDLSDD